MAPRRLPARPRAGDKLGGMRTALQFGAGNIGRGFTGHLFTEAGFEVVFVDVAPELVAALNERRAYPLRLAGPDRHETLTIGPVRAVDGRDVAAVAAEVAACAFACTAVGVAALPHLVPALAAGIRARRGTLDVILCENQLHCSDLLRGLLAAHLPPADLDRVGLVESVVSRMAPVLSPAERAGDPLLAVAEDYPVLPVDGSAFRGPVPPVPALRPVADFPAWVERKLFVHNLGHAVAAYLGARAGCATIAGALEQAEVRAACEGAMAESCEALARRHGLDRGDLARHRGDLLRRFANPALGDTVARVARDPVRKLRPDDRLVGAALLCLDQGVEPACIARGIAAALAYADPGDAAAEEVRAEAARSGPAGAFRRFTGQPPEGELGRLVLAAWGAPTAGCPAAGSA